MCYRLLSLLFYLNLIDLYEPCPYFYFIFPAVANQLDKHTVGYLTWKAGLQSGMSTMIIRDTEYSHMVCSVYFGLPHTYTALSYTHKLLARESKLKLTGK